MIRYILIGIFIFGVGQIQAQQKHYNVLEYGAKTDTTVLSTHAIQKAIDACYENGGGVVQFPEGHYLTGTIVLKSNVSLVLDKGAVIYASRNINHYRMPLNEATKPILIYANGADSISISGDGEINGQASHEYIDLKKTDRYIKETTKNAKLAGVEMKRYYIVKPNVGLINFANCKKVKMNGVIIRESSFWSVHMVKCSDVEINSIQIYSSLERGVNADGLDINSCQRVNVSNCLVETGDDAIVLKTRYNVRCEHIKVSNCTLTSSSSALKIGTETRGDFNDILFENCTVKNSNRGMSIVVLDGASVSNVKFSNINIECNRRHFNWWGNADAVWLFVGKRYEESEIGEIRNISFENISAIVRGTSRVESEFANRIHDIRFENFKIRMKKEDYADKRADHAFLAKSVDGLVLNNIDISWDEDKIEPKWRSALYLEDVHNSEVYGFNGRQGILGSEVPVVQLWNSSDMSLSNLRFSKGSETGVRIGGDRTGDVRINRLDVDGVCNQPVIYNESLIDTKRIIIDAE